MVEYLINAFRSDIKVFILSPIKMCGVKHTVVWSMAHRSSLWYHRFALCVEESKERVNYPQLINLQKMAQNRRYRFPYNPTYDNFLMKRTFLKVLQKFDVNKDELDEIMGNLKAYESDVFHHEFLNINKEYSQLKTGR